jgi:hypothetical protein
MNDITALHREAVELADQADDARRRGDLDRSASLLRSAFEKERDAAVRLVDELDLEPSRSVLYRSAASLALECGLWRDAERLIATALAGEPPTEIAEELRELLTKTYAQRQVQVNA